MEERSTFTLRARWILPIDQPPIAGGYVTVANGRITEIDRGRPSVASRETIDLGDAVLLPGLVNAHTHLEFSDLSAPLGAPNMSLPEWIRLVIANRHRKNRDAATSIAAGLAESLVSGVTTVGDIATAPASAYRTAETRPALLLLQESIGFSAARVESAFADVERRLSESATTLADDEQPPIAAGLSPHAPYTVHPALLERTIDLAVRQAVPVAMHLAESREELELLADGGGPFRELLEERSMWDGDAIPTGTRPLDYLRALARAPRAIVVHGNYLTADEIAFLAELRDRMSVVYCPRTHAYFGHEPYRLESMLEAGVRLALGTDSRASNPDLSLLGELRAAAQRHANMSPTQFVRMATLSGAEALGLGEDAGSLTPGKRADLLALPCGTGDPHEAIVASGTCPSAIWLAGVRVFEERR